MQLKVQTYMVKDMMKKVSLKKNSQINNARIVKFIVLGFNLVVF